MGREPSTTSASPAATSSTPQPTDEGPLGWSLLPRPERSELLPQPIQAFVNDRIRNLRGYSSRGGRWTFVGAPVLFCAAMTALFIPQLSREQEHRVDPSLASAPAPRVWHGFRGPTTTLPAPTTTEAPKVAHAVAPRTSRSRTGGGWDALKQCESGGDYNTNSGNGFYGAYQFDRGTWNANNVAGGSWGSATPEQQDAAAQHLYAQRGASPWPICGRHLGG